MTVIFCQPKIYYKLFSSISAKYNILIKVFVIRLLQGWKSEQLISNSKLDFNFLETIPATWLQRKYSCKKALSLHDQGVLNMLNGVKIPYV